MELQWPLILFTTLIAASAGLFGTQGAYALAGKGQKAQVPALITSVVLLAVGGIAVFFHLTHPDRLFNGFGHLTSGITQELIAIVVMAIVMVLFFVNARKEGSVPKWLGILAIAVALILVAVMGHSYMVASRPAWSSVMQPLSLIGAGCAIGTGIFAALDAKEDEDSPLHGLLTIAGTAIGAICTAIYAFTMNGATGKFTDVGYYFDTTRATIPVVDPNSFGPFSGGNAGLTIGAIVLMVAALALAFWGRSSKKWSTAGWAIAACALISAVLLRMAFYNAGGSVYLFY